MNWRERVRVIFSDSISYVGAGLVVGAAFRTNAHLGEFALGVALLLMGWVTSE